MDNKLITEKIEYINDFRVVVLRPRLTEYEYNIEETKIANKLLKRLREINKNNMDG